MLRIDELIERRRVIDTFQPDQTVGHLVSNSEEREKFLSAMPSIEREEAERAILPLFENEFYVSPKRIVWCSSPWVMKLAFCLVYRKFADGRLKTVEEIRDYVPSSVWDGLEAAMRVIMCDAPESDSWSRRIVHGPGRYRQGRVQHWPYGWVVPWGGVVVASERPSVLKYDERGLLHSLAGPAIAFRDGWSIHMMHGTRVPEYVIERPHEITVKHIDEENNAEIRRVMIEQYGPSRYVRDSNVQILDQDATGILYKHQRRPGEGIAMVRLLNSAPEPDGALTRDEAIAIFGDAAKAAINAPEDARFKDYWICVPSTMRTAREAVAWTFGLGADDYQPAIES